MFASFRLSALSILLVLALLSGCEDEAPISPNAHDLTSAVRPVIAISDTAAFEAAWNGGNFADGTTFQVPSATTLQWFRNVQFQATNKTFTLAGADTTSVLKKSYSGGGPIAFFSASGQADDSLAITNLKFVAGGASYTFFGGTFPRIDVTNVVVDLQAQSFTLTANRLTVDGLALRANFGSGFHHRSRFALPFEHVIRNSAFFRKATGSGPCKATISFPGAGTVTWEDNEFDANSSSDGTEFYDVHVSNPPTDIDFTFTQNNFRKQNILFNNLCDNGTVNVFLNDNNSEAAFCGDGVEIIECDACEPPTDFFLNVFLSGWSFEGEPFDYDDFGPISGQNACYDANDIVYVEFALATTEPFEAYQQVEVEWGDDDCTSGGGTVGAVWNASTSKWNASFDVSTIGDADIYWRGKATLCSKTVTGDCIRRRFTLCGAGGVPVWFTQR